MARKGGKDRGLVEKPKGSGHWYVQLCAAGQASCIAAIVNHKPKPSMVD